MKHNMMSRILCLILALCTVFSMVPMTYATEAEEPVEAELVEVISEDTVPEEEVTVSEDTPEVEPVAELPYGLKGMPEGYMLTEEQKESKRQLAENGDMDALRAAVPDVDYVANEVITLAETEAEARMIAEAYNGTLKSFDNNLAVIALDEIGVADAVALSADLRYNLPVVSQNDIVALDPVVDNVSLKDNSVLTLVPQRMEWADWNLNDPFLKNPNGDNASTSTAYQWWHDTVDTYAAWGVTTGDRNVKVAVLDTGVNASHEELAGRVTSYSVKVGTTTYGYADGNGHGSNVAGIIAASMNNGRGGAGIAPNVSIMSVKVLDDDGSGSAAMIIAGINGAVSKGAWIINMSLGGAIYNQTYQNAINNAVAQNVTVIAAMGNNGTNLKCYPAGYNNVIAVAAADRTNNRAYFSNYGSWCDVAAPGYYMWSSSYQNASAYVRMNGTSQATPVVSGLAALYMSVYGRVSPATMEKVLEASCVKGGANLGKGIVNAANMFSKTKPTVDYYVYDNYGTKYYGKSVPCDSWLNLSSSGEMILYTTDGKSPSVKNGEVVTGTVYSGTINLSQFAGKTVTVKTMAINGLGIAGAVKTIKLTVSTSSAISSIAVEGPTRLVAGKSATYKATVSPAKANQGVSWSIVEKVGMSSAKISSSGKLTTSSAQEGYVVIRATSKVNPSKYKDFKVQTLKMNPVSSMALSFKSYTLTLGTNSSSDRTLWLSISKMVDKYGNPISPGYSGVQWTSSKESVATVSNGKVTAVAPGTATITCKALDGSGKSATCKITVKQRVSAITISGNTTIAPGSSATYKANILPSNASSKSVTWSLSGAPYGAKISSSGKVTIPKSAYTGGSFLVIATAKDGSGKWGSMYVDVQAKCKNLYLKYSDHDSRLVTTKSNGYVSSAVLYTREGSYYSGNDTTMSLTPIGSNITPTVKWSSSKESVATVDSYGNVRAVNAGTATITAAAQDGSGKKATVTVTVRNPVSSMSITTSAPRANGEDAYLTFGKSATNTVTFADTYGTPSNKGVTWSFRLYQVNSNMQILNDWTYSAKVNRWVTVSSSGKVTVSSSLKNRWLNMSGDFVLLVDATSTDNPNVSATQGYWLVKGASYMYKARLIGSRLYKDTSTIRISRNSTYQSSSNNIVVIACDMYRPLSNKYPYQYEMTVSSSNPDVVGVQLIQPYFYSGSNYYTNVFLVALVGGNKSGTAKITVKAGDGSGKSCTFTVKVS